MSEPSTSTVWDGAVLCGGRSRRMGRDKALVVVEGEPMVLRVARALHQAGAQRVVTVGGNQPGIAAALEPLTAEGARNEQNAAPSAQPPRGTEAGGGWVAPPQGSLGAVARAYAATVADEAPGEGPVGGVLTALAATTSPVVLVVACDLVAPSCEAMATTVAALVADPAADLAAPVRGLQTEWLHAAWHRRARQPLAARFAAGERAIHRAVADAELTVRTVPGLDPAVLADADTPSDLAG